MSWSVYQLFDTRFPNKGLTIPKNQMVELVLTAFQGITYSEPEIVSLSLFGHAGLMLKF